MSPYPRDYARPTCYTCLRPEAHCVCNFIAPFRAHCNLLILQHPNEWRKYYSTTKLLARAVTNSKTLRSVYYTPEDIAAVTENQRVYVLFPYAHAVDCEATALDESCTVIAVDGTWSEAKKILFRNPFLKEYPAVSFSRPLRSRFRIRKQPSPECLSTLESVAHLLTLNAAAFGHKEKVPLYNSLFEGFEKMVEKQLSYWPSKPGI